METIKLGSKGEAVKLLQSKLNLIADGVFGPNTDKAVKAFQLKNKLTADGIVGPATWKVLGVNDYNSKCIDNSVIYKPLSVHVTKCLGRPIKYLAIHFTAGSNSNPGKALNTYNTFISNSASADFVVDDKDIVQFNPDIPNYYCWAVGDSKKSSISGGKYYGLASNKNTISIEICSTCTPSTKTAVSKPNHKGWSFTPKVLANTTKLAKLLIKRYNIPKSNIIRHYDITGKLCPGIIGWNDDCLYDYTNGSMLPEKNNSNEWIKFKNDLLK